MIWDKIAGEIVSTDMDGVLCKDGEPLKPLLLPSYPVEEIITGRHERHRKATESWLSAHGVKYKKLCMMDVDSRDWKDIAEYKARIIKESKATVFIESDGKQARYIAETLNGVTNG